ncbi:hypothetical protein ACGFLT_08390 [Micromonospora chalcea]|uniref:Pepco domain-containing protein n=1 Tax=Micromonospora chalcea TaxID=1874 RepID=UPI0034048374
MSQPVTDVDTLPFLVSVEVSDDPDTMGLFRKGEREVAVRHIPIAVLRESVRHTVAALRTVFDEVAEETGRLRLAEAQFSFEVSAKGGLNLVGTTEIGSKGAVTLTFRG